MLRQATTPRKFRDSAGASRIDFSGLFSREIDIGLIRSGNAPLVC